MTIEKMTTDEIINEFKNDFGTLISAAKEDPNVRQAVEEAFSKGLDPKAIRASLVTGALMAWLMLKKQGALA